MREYKVGDKVKIMSKQIYCILAGETGISPSLLRNERAEKILKRKVNGLVSYHFSKDMSKLCGKICIITTVIWCSACRVYHYTLEEDKNCHKWDEWMFSQPEQLEFDFNV
jgi:hypothetical protein